MGQNAGMTQLDVPGPWPAKANAIRTSISLAGRLPQPITYVLAGGGAHGSVQWGLLQALAETDIHPSALIGTSAGALTASVVAEDPIAACTRLAYVWSQLNLDVLMGDSWMSMVRATTRRKRSLASNDAERTAIESILCSRRFEELQLPMTAVATDLATGKATAFDNGDLVSALLASSAIPGVLPPVKRGGRFYIDGLASANLPARLAVERGAGSIVVFDTGSRQPSALGPSPTKVVNRVNRVLARHQRDGQLLYAGQHVPTIVLPTPTNMGPALNFRETMEAGARSYELAREFLSDLESLLAGSRRRVRTGLYCREPGLPLDPEFEEATTVVPRLNAGTA